MNPITRTLAGAAFACVIASGAHAATVQSMTIEEIGVASGGLGTSALAGGGGWGDYWSNTATHVPAPAYFVSDGPDGALIMGTQQANGAISTGFIWNGENFGLNTLNSAPHGSLVDGVMTLNLSGLVAEYLFDHIVFPIAPDASTLITSVSMIDARHYFYTADWTHTFNNDVYSLNTLAIHPAWNGSGVTIHLEGIATLAPVPEPETYAMMLAGLGLIGLIAAGRRRA